ncbi:MAG: multicopper oxidase domain-containing protein, partial [Candidatus Eremiobacteraeota bacterium]|nr:multicopper oxidase domain-containing protein [Candidatus Eremiobacteraeota bacterium]
CRACGAETGLQPTLNRRADAHIGIRPGERQFFRVVNASAARYYDLSVDGTPLELVALDGVPLDAYPGTPPTRTVNHVLIPPAGRAEFVVTGPDHPTVLRSACVDTGAAGDANPAVVLAHFVDPTTVAGGTAAPVAVPVPSVEPLRVGAPLPRNVLSRALPPPAAHRTIRFTEDDHGFYLDGKAFAMDAPPAVVARSGTVEEWTLTNATDEVHAFHIHQVHFVPLAVDGVAVVPRTWADTVNVPPRRRHGGSWVPGTVRIVVDFRDPVVRGTFLYHCHILDHEDQGMMAKIRVI